MPTLQGVLPNTLNEPDVTRILYINVAGTYSEKQRTSIRIALHSRIAGLGWESDHSRTAYIYFKRNNHQSYAILEASIQARINDIPNFLTADGALFRVDHTHVQFSLMISLPRDVVAVEPVVQNDGNERQAVQVDGNDESAVRNEENEEPVDQNDDVKKEEVVVGDDATDEPMARDVKVEEPSTSDVKTEDLTVRIDKLEIKEEENNDETPK
ncbi:unnamed protein product [Caenorhabditis nigoni]